MKFHGWRIAWALAVTQTVGYGVLYYAYSVFTVPMEAELGLTRAQTSGAFSLGLLLSGLAAMPIGRWVDARGARVPMSVGSLLGAVCVLLWSYTDSLTGLFLTQAGIGLAMGLTLYDVAFTVLAAWFRRDRIKAMLVVTMVAGLASTIFVPVATAALEGFGWRGALRLLALVLAASCIPLHSLVLRDHPRRLGQEPDGAFRVRPGSEAASGAASAVAAPTAAPSASAVSAVDPPEHAIGTREALRSGLFWWLTAAFVADRLAIVAIAAHSVPLLLERGYAPALVAAVAGTIGFVQVVGRVVFAPAARVFSLYTLAVGTYLTRVVALIVILVWPGGAGLWLFAALFGLANGASTLARGGLVGEAFGSANYGSINGTMATFIAASGTVAPLGVGLLHVRTGGYDAALWLLVGAGVVAAFAAQKARGAAAARRVAAGSA